MKYLEQKPGLLWWTKNPRYLLYFVREINGILLGFFAFAWIIFLIAVSLLWKYAYNTHPLFLVAVSFLLPFLTFGTWITSIIHTLTWLSAMPKILPLRLSAFGQKIAYVLLLAFWLALTFTIIVLLIKLSFSPE